MLDALAASRIGIDADAFDAVNGDRGVKRLGSSVRCNPEGAQHCAGIVKSYDGDPGAGVAADFVLVDRTGARARDCKVLAVPKERRAGVACDGGPQGKRAQLAVAFRQLKEDVAARPLAVTNGVGKKVPVAVVRAIPEVRRAGIFVVVRCAFGVKVNRNAAFGLSGPDVADREVPRCRVHRTCVGMPRSIVENSEGAPGAVRVGANLALP